MLKEPDNQSSGKATAKIDRKTAAAASTFRLGDEDPYDSDSYTEHHFTYLAQDGLEDCIMRLNARLAYARAASCRECSLCCGVLWLYPVARHDALLPERF